MTGQAIELSPSLAEVTSYLLRRAFELAQESAATLPEGLRPGDYAILTALSAIGPVSQKELAERLRVNPSIMVGLIDDLQAAGLVERSRDRTDRRRYALALTDPGVKSLNRIKPHIDRGDARFTRRLNPRERDRLKELLLRMLWPNGEPLWQTKLTRYTGYLVSIAHFRCRERAEELLAPLGIDPRQFGALAAISDLTSGSQRDLARLLCVSGTLIGRLVDGLESGGLVTRRRDPGDRRPYHLGLTPSGLHTLRGARQALSQLSGEITHRVGDDGDQELRLLLRKLLGAREWTPRPAGRA